MRVGPSATQRRAQTSDLENYPGSTLGQSPQQQAGALIVTGVLQSAAGSSFNRAKFLLLAIERKPRVKSTLRDCVSFLSSFLSFFLFFLFFFRREKAPLTIAPRCATCCLGYTRFLALCVSAYRRWCRVFFCFFSLNFKEAQLYIVPSMCVCVCVRDRKDG